METVEFLTEPQLLSRARGLNIPLSRATLYREKANGKIAFYRFGRSIRYTEQDLIAYAARMRKGV